MIVSTETGGLGNRIKSWVSAMRADDDARVQWPVGANMPAAFTDLFSNDCALERVPEGAHTRGSWRLDVLPEDEPYLPRDFSPVNSRRHPFLRGPAKMLWELRGRPTDRYRYMVFPKTNSARSARADGRHIDLEYERIPAYFRDVYVPLFARISVQPRIADAVSAWSSAYLDADVVGVQIRTWRDASHRHRKYYLPSRRRLTRLMDDEPDATRFLVVSDSDDVITELAGSYGKERILSYPRHTPRAASWERPEGVAEDLMDMLLLAQTERLFASYLSTFSESAWWLGGACARVEVF